MCDYNDCGDDFASECSYDLLSDDPIINDVSEANGIPVESEILDTTLAENAFDDAGDEHFESLEEDIKMKNEEFLTSGCCEVFDEDMGDTMTEDTTYGDVVSDEVCPVCGPNPCACDNNDTAADFPCPVCGYFPCVCKLCPVCGQTPCVCESDNSPPFCSG